MISKKIQEIDSEIDRNWKEKIDAKAHYLTNKNIWSAISMNVEKQSPVFAPIKKKVQPTA